MSQSRGKFLTDLQNGERGERHVSAFLQKQLEATEIIPAAKGTKGYDFMLVYSDESCETYEVKTDFSAAKTGNLFFEYSCSGKDSGLAATTANEWAVFVPHSKQILVFSPYVMFDLLQKSSYRNLRGGDRKAVCGYIVPQKDVIALDFVKTFSTEGEF